MAVCPPDTTVRTALSLADLKTPMIILSAFHPIGLRKSTNVRLSGKRKTFEPYCRIRHWDPTFPICCFQPRHPAWSAPDDMLFGCPFDLVRLDQASTPDNYSCLLNCPIAMPSITMLNPMHISRSSHSGYLCVRSCIFGTALAIAAFACGGICATTALGILLKMLGVEPVMLTPLSAIPLSMSTP